jgi:hypothetical protein
LVRISAAKRLRDNAEKLARMGATNRVEAHDVLQANRALSGVA